MRVDVSEIKTYRECHRKHLYSSRNRMKLYPRVTNDNLQFGTWFHECLHKMYMRTSIEDILLWIDNTVENADMNKMLTKMVTGYYETVYLEDASRYDILDIEHSFDWILDPVEYSDIHVCGSIDMLAVDKKNNTLVGFEHKSGKNFRPEIYDFIDEQPRLYYIILQMYLEDHPELREKYPGITVGGVMVNQVKKLKTQFQYKRDLLSYSQKDLDNFLSSFMRDAIRILHRNPQDELPSPGFMKCQMCDYADICMKYGYENLTEDKILKDVDLNEEYYVKEKDHLDEKQEEFHS